jgi:hypothetical protein
MIRKIVRAVALLVLSSGATLEAQTTTAIIGARVIDGTGAPARLETVVLQGGRILAVSSNAQIPPGARVLDWPAASFSGKEKWKTVRIPFTSLRERNSTSHLALRSVRTLHFELARSAGADAWLEIDDIKLY